MMERMLVLPEPLLPISNTCRANRFHGSLDGQLRALKIGPTGYTIKGRRLRNPIDERANEFKPAANEKMWPIHA